MVNNPSWSLIAKVIVVSFAMTTLMVFSHKAMAQSQNYDLTYLCSDGGQSTFVVENNTSEPLAAQEAYIDANGQTLPVERVDPNGDTFVYPAIVEGQVDLYVGTSLVDSATATNEPCEVTNDQYSNSEPAGSDSTVPDSGDSDRSDNGDGNRNNSSQEVGSSNLPSEASQYNEGHDTPNNSSQSSTEANRGVSGNPSGIDVLPDTSGAAFWTLGAGVLLISGGVLFRKLM